LFIHGHKLTFKHLCWHIITKILRNGPRAHFPFKAVGSLPRGHACNFAGGRLAALMDPCGGAVKLLAVEGMASQVGWGSDSTADQLVVVVAKQHVTKHCDKSKRLDNFFPRDTPLGDATFHLYINRISPCNKDYNCHSSNSLPLICNTLSALARENRGRRRTLTIFDKNRDMGLQIDRRGMEQTVSLRIRRMREVLHVVDDVLLEAYVAGQDAAIPPVNAIPEHRVQVQNVHFCVIHGWTSVVPLPEVECGLPIAFSSPPVPMGDAESSATAPMDVDLVAPSPPPPTAAAVRHCSPTSQEMVVVGTITARRGQSPRAVDALRGRIIFTGHHPKGVATSFSSNVRA
jgi:hypothetical protein